MRSKQRAATLAILLMVSHAMAHAELFKCKNASGGLTIQDAPCAPPGGTPPAPRPIPGQKNESFARKQGTQPDGNWSPRSAQDVAAMANLPKTPPPVPAATHAVEPPAKSPPTWQQQDAAFQQRQRQAKADALATAEQEKRNRMPCQRAIDNLAALRVESPVMRTDKNGSRYVSDDDRPAHVKRAERQVAESCN